MRREIALLSLCFLFVSCASSVKLVNQGNINSDIEMQTYRIKIENPNQWKKWAMEKNVAGEDSLSLEKLKKWAPNGEVQGRTNILIKKIELDLSWESLSQEEKAKKIMDIEESIMIKEGVEKGAYRLENVERLEFNRNNKKFYRMNYEAKNDTAMSASWNRQMFTKASLIIYFPENDSLKNSVFIFHISEGYIPLSLLRPDTDQILNVIENFEVK